MSKDRSGPAPAPHHDPAPTEARERAPVPSTRAQIDAFLARVNTLAPAATAGGRGRLVFALDATMSRQPTWDQACVLQADMFREAAAVGGLDIQLAYYRGLAECRASPWVAEPRRLGALMSRISCHGGHTQIAKILAHARRENDKARIGALVFVGDAMEESLDDLCAGAGELGLRNVPAFMFQEGYDPVCEQAFREIARLTRGAYCRFGPGAAHELGELLRAAAAYAAGGLKALADLQARRGSAAIRLIEQLK
ncbi:MAG TPA: VWA domain-containing protein [Xanthobacteraceae bacterium]|nr:VWA domain-containing protein [Xanthobacteraceae bacterium]